MQWLGKLAARAAPAMLAKLAPGAVTTLLLLVVSGLVLVGLLDEAQVLAFCESLSSSLHNNSRVLP